MGVPPREVSLRDQLKRQEAVRLFPYQDDRGNWTIGVGHNLSADPIMFGELEILKRDGITMIELESLLDEDIYHAVTDANRELPWLHTIDWPRQAAIINMTFNMGIAKLVKWTHFLGCMQEGKWEEATNWMLYNAPFDDGTTTPYFNQVHGRALELAKQIREGVIV